MTTRKEIPGDDGEVLTVLCEPVAHLPWHVDLSVLRGRLACERFSVSEAAMVVAGFAELLRPMIQRSEASGQSSEGNG